MKRKLSTFILCCSLLFCFNNMQATHILGGEITYRCLQNSVYEVTLVYYRDCMGITLSQTQFVNWNDSCSNGTISLNQVSVIEVSPVFWGVNSSCNGGTGIGVEKVTYVGYQTLPATCGPVFFNRTTCCRSNAITNISSPGSTEMNLTTVAEVDIACNSTPTFGNTPIIMGCINQPLNYNMMAQDPDNDSLVFHLTDCSDFSSSTTYNPAYSGVAPLGTFAPVTIDPNTGDISVTPVQQEIAAVCVLVEEYRNGVLIGTLVREIQCVIIQDCNSISNSLISGNVIQDNNMDCIRDASDYDLAGRNVVLNPGGFVRQTDQNGYFQFYGVPVGNYQLSLMYDSSLWAMNCPVSGGYNVNVTGTNDSLTNNDFFLSPDQLCSDLQVDVSIPVMRPCFNTNNVYVYYCNDLESTIQQDSVYVTVELDTSLTVLGSSLPYVALGGNTFQFYVGTLLPGDCGTISLNCFLSCSTPIGASVCANALITPVDSCIYRNDSLPGSNPCGPWDKSSLMVEGTCVGDSLVCFNVINTGDPGDGDMDCYQEIRVFIDTALYITDSILLTGGDTAVFCFPSNGYTWRLEADQHPLHPGNSHPNAVVELCGDSAAINQNWTAGLPNQYPANDDDINYDEDCREATAGYDPNDKQGYPTGISSMHYILPNTDIEYMVRFQNTGNDTAFNVVIVDTLSPHLDVNSLQLGAASHNFTFRLLAENVLEWTFPNIMLPDSSTNLEGSQGFFAFKIAQQPNLPLGTYIYNEAHIYFDFNPAIVTNETEHLIGEPNFTWTVASTQSAQELEAGIWVYPNPTSNQLNIQSAQPMQAIQLFSIDGRLLEQQRLNAQTHQLHLHDYPTGIYLLQIRTKDAIISKKLIKQ